MRIHLIDGTWELFRAHFSPRPSHTSPSGKDNKATLGVVQSLLALLHNEAEDVTHIAAAFDNPIRSFRNKLFAGYKTEEGVPPELLAQFDDVEAGVRALGVTVWSMKEFEADDALASGAAAALKDKRVTQVRICTPDKDLGQCLYKTRVVQVDRMREREITAASFAQDRGYAPESVPDFLGLVGDTADGIPGLDGWGEKTAAKVLGRYPHLEKIPDDPSAWDIDVRGKERLAATLAAHRKDAVLYRTLATLKSDVKLFKSVDEIAFEGVPRAEFTRWCERAGSPRTTERLKGLRTRP